MSLEITGKLIEILPEKNGEGRNGTWRKQEFVVETEEQYPKKICLNLWGDRVDMLGNLSKGDSIKVYFNVESREYQGKWYTDAKAWRVESFSQDSVGQYDSQEAPTQNPPPMPDDLIMPEGQSQDDLPF